VTELGIVVGSGRMSPPNTTPEIGQLSLGLHGSNERLRHLQKERERLSRQVAKKKAELERAAERARHESDEMAAAIAPLAQKFETLRLELRALFDELLSAGRLSPKARKEVQKVIRALEEQGMLERSPEAPRQGKGETPWDESDEPDMSGEEAFGSGPAESASSAYSKREVASAETRGQTNQSVRDLFRRLARSLHPDRARHDAERERLTTIMKEVTSAYQDGDLARLLALEQAWAKDASIAPVGDETQRCRELERLNRALRAQLATVNRELRQLRRSVEEGALDMPLEATIACAESELAALEAMRAFVGDFRDGKISLRRFVMGPESLSIDDRELSALVYELTQQLAEDARGAGARHPKRKRKSAKRRSG
jgi:hypothetical protein